MCTWITQDMHSVHLKSILGCLFIFSAYEGMKGCANDYAKSCNLPAHTLSSCLFCFGGLRGNTFSTVSAKSQIPVEELCEGLVFKLISQIRTRLGYAQPLDHLFFLESKCSWLQPPGSSGSCPGHHPWLLFTDAPVQLACGLISQA